MLPLSSVFLYEGGKNIHIPGDSDVMTVSVAPTFCWLLLGWLKSFVVGYTVWGEEGGLMAAASSLCSLLEMFKMEEQPGLCNQNTMALLCL